MSSFTQAPLFEYANKRSDIRTGGYDEVPPPSSAADEGLLEVGAHVAELARGALAQEGDRDDADDGDQGDEQCVLDEAGAVFVPAQTGTQVRGDDVLPVVEEVHRYLPLGSLSRCWVVIDGSGASLECHFPPPRVDHREMVPTGHGRPPPAPPR